MRTLRIWGNRMLPATICFLSVICTASLASFGMDVSVIVPSSSKAFPEKEDVARVNSECTVFYEFFAAATIIVCIVYYIVFRVTLSAMGAVAIRQRPSAESLVELVDVVAYGGGGDHGEEEEEDEESEEARSDPEEEEGEEMSKQKHPAAVASAAACSSPTSSISSFDFSLPGEDGGSSAGPAPPPPPPTRQNPADHGTTKKKKKKRRASREADEGRSSRNNRAGGRGSGAETAARRRPPRRAGSSSHRGGDAASNSSLHQQHHHPRHAGAAPASPVRVWTNIYGLSVGVYCLVYSLLFPNELSALVFCIATLVITLQQVLSPFISAYVYDEMGLRGLHAAGNSPPPASHRRSGLDAWNKFRRRFKRCVGWLCIFHDSIRHDIGQTIQEAVPSMRRRSSAASLSRGRRVSVLRQCVRGGSMCVPILIVIVAIGLGFKVIHMQDCTSFSASPPAIHRRDLFNDTGNNVTETISPSAADALDDVSVPLVFIEASKSNVSSAALELETAAPLPSAGNDSANASANTASGSSSTKTTTTTTTLAGTVTSILFPIVGVFMIRSMKTAENLRETMELAVPAFGINSVCIACLIFLFNPACFRRHLSLVVTVDSAYWYDAAVSSLSSSPSSNASSSAGVHLTPSHDDTILQLESIMSLLALPFPLVCSIVCIVAAGKNRRFMDIAAAVFLAYACRTHTALGHKRGCAGYQENQEEGAVIVIQGLPPARSETIALGCAITVCVLLMLHRLYWGDDYGIAYSGGEEYEPVVFTERSAERRGLLMESSTAGAGHEALEEGDEERDVSKAAAGP